MSKDKDRRKKQWHPEFAAMLRPLMQRYFDVQTNVPVGDAPREADILLLRRTAGARPPFRGLWSHLTLWNVLEFKGPSVSARLRDLDLLVELGLGIDRRLSEEEQRQRRPVPEPEQVSFWYIVKSMGGRFLSDARRRLGQLDEISAGLWRSQVLQRLVFLVSSDTFATEPDSVPLHLLVQRSPEEERELARLIVEQPRYWEWYASALSMYHPAAWKEVREMARAKGKELEPDFGPLIEEVGMERIIESLGFKRVFETVGPAKIIDEMGVDWLISKLPPAKLKQLKEHLK
jgi:hypothetical protein